jgi:protein TonB
MRPIPVPVRSGRFRGAFLGSVALHAAVLGAAATLAAAPAPLPERPGVWIEMTRAEVRDAMPVEASEVPVPQLPPVVEPVPEDEPSPEPTLEPLPVRETDPPEPLAPTLSLEVVGRRTKPPPPPPAPVLAPTARRPSAPVVRQPVAVPRAPSRPPATSAAPLRLLHRPLFTAADYPVEARRLRIQGTALVRITIGTSGLVVDAVLVGSSGSPLLDADAVAKARLYRFAPIPSPRVENLPVLYALD